VKSNVGEGSVEEPQFQAPDTALFVATASGATPSSNWKAGSESAESERLHTVHEVGGASNASKPKRQNVRVA